MLVYIKEELFLTFPIPIPMKSLTPIIFEKENSHIPSFVRQYKNIYNI